MTSITGLKERSFSTRMNSVADEPKQQPLPGRTWQENLRGHHLRPKDEGVIVKKAITFQKIYFSNYEISFP
jgi:hypothetical protein